MRGNIAVVSLLAAGLLVSSGPATSETAAPPAPQPLLPEEVERGVIVDLADGDRFKATVSIDERTVWGSRYDAATRSWSKRSVVLRKKDLYCGDVDARAAGSAVALIAECDFGGWSEDTAPADSHALHSPDTVSWTSYRLPGEAYDEPGISPSGTHAVWPLHGGWVTYGPAGFRLVERQLADLEYTETATISDAGDVSVLYGGSVDGECAIQVLDVAASGAETTQRLPLENACSDVNMANTDLNTVLFGEFQYPEWVSVISRPDASSPWAVARTVPAEAPGLVLHRGRGTARTEFATSRGLPLLAVGSADRHSFTAQSYDPATGGWTPPVEVLQSAARCDWSNTVGDEALGVVALRLECGKDKRPRVLISTDAERWYAVRLGRTPLGVSAHGTYVAASNRSRTLIFSQELGRVRLPLPRRARCDVIQPVGPDSAIRLSTKKSDAGWPSVLHESTRAGWRRTNTRIPRLGVGKDTCVRAEERVYDGQTRYVFLGRERAVSFSIAASGSGWRIRDVVPGIA